MRYMWGKIQYDNKKEKEKQQQINNKLMEELRQKGFIKEIKK